MKFQVISNINMIYNIEADNKEEALNKVLSGDLEPNDSEVISNEVNEK